MVCAFTPMIELNSSFEAEDGKAIMIRCDPFLVCGVVTLSNSDFLASNSDFLALTFSESTAVPWPRLYSNRLIRFGCGHGHCQQLRISCAHIFGVARPLIFQE